MRNGPDTKNTLDLPLQSDVRVWREKEGWAGLLVALRWLHWLHAIALCSNSFLIILCSTILSYIYHLCALEVVASGIDDIIVQTVFKAAVEV
jgi:hypothetical protein